jgi:hypothetical protein
MTERQLWVIDDFYPDPDRVRERALALEYEEPEAITGFRSRPLHPRGVRGRIERALGRRVTDWEHARDPEGANGVFFLAFADGDRAETPGVHWDEPTSFATMLVYLTPDPPPDSGTSLWRHRETGLTDRPTVADARRLGVPVAELEGWIERDAWTPGAWEEIDRIGNRYNRAVCYPAHRLHSATRHFGRTLADGRIYQSFHFGLSAP